jgi:hypothetical protein
MQVIQTIQLTLIRPANVETANAVQPQVGIFVETGNAVQPQVGTFVETGNAVHPSVGATHAEQPTPYWSIMSLASSLIRYDDELKRRLEKLSRTYDLTTMKIFVAVECVGEQLVCGTYDKAKTPKWEVFLARAEACRLDLSKHEKNKEKYHEFVSSVPREEQGKAFHSAMLSFLQYKGAADIFGQISPKNAEELNSTFCGHLCKLFERKIEQWFDSFEAVSLRLTGHVKVSNFVRVLGGQVDALCRKGRLTYAVSLKVTTLDTPRPIDIAELCLYKVLLIQNGLGDPSEIRLCLLILHLTQDRPILRMWEYTPTDEMERSIREADIDKLIDAGKLSQYHEFWRENVHLVGPPTEDNVY